MCLLGVTSEFIASSIIAKIVLTLIKEEIWVIVRVKWNHFILESFGINYDVHMYPVLTQWLRKKGRVEKICPEPVPRCNITCDSHPMPVQIALGVVT